MSKKVLLVADDEEMNRLIIRKFLKDDYEVIEAKNGQETLDTIREKHVDAMLLDIIMPERDGLEVLEEMRKESAFDHIGVLVATSTKEKTERMALELGADDIVSKPYDPVVIKRRMKNILAVKAIHAQKQSLLTEDTDAYVQQNNDKIYQQIESGVTKITKFADIINANKSNFKLVGEVTDEIKKEATMMLKQIDIAK